MSTAGVLLRETRQRHGLSQRALALRAGTTQAWISQLERGTASPTLETLRRLLVCMGEDLALETRRMPGHREHDPVAFDHVRSQSMDERLADGAAWGRLAASTGRR